MLKGQKAHSDRLKRLSGAEVIRAAGRVVFVGAQLIQTEAQHGITAGSVSGKNHQPSPAGTPPHNDTGVLKDGIETAQTGPAEAEVSSNAPYSAVHEFGGSKHPQRPFMRPARDKMEPKIQRLFETEIDKLVKRSG